MIHSVVKIFISVTAITSPLFFSTYGTAMCDLEKTTISLKAYNKPVAGILKDIENQTKFTIDVPNSKLLDNKISIELDKSPLDTTLKRLLKSINYSIICDSERKSLTLVLLDKSALSSSVSTQSTTNNVETGSMAALSAALEDYRNGVRYPESPHKDPPGMEGMSAALEDYRNGVRYPEAPHKDPPGMEGMSAALEDYKNGVRYPETPHKDPPGMEGMSAALEDYRNGVRYPEAPHKDPPGMEGMSAALEDYRNGVRYPEARH